MVAEVPCIIYFLGSKGCYKSWQKKKKRPIQTYFMSGQVFRSGPPSYHQHGTGEQWSSGANKPGSWSLLGSNFRPWTPTETAGRASRPTDEADTGPIGIWTCPNSHRDLPGELNSKKKKKRKRRLLFKGSDVLQAVLDVQEQTGINHNTPHQIWNMFALIGVENGKCTQYTVYEHAVL